MNKTLQQKRFLGLVLLVLVAALYGQFLWNPIVFDDVYFFVLNQDGTQPVDSYKFVLLELRSLPYATLAWTKAWFGLDMIYFRIGNLLLHVGVALALFAFLSAVFEAVYGNADEEGLSPKMAGFFAALLFALHPVATYAAGYLVQRTIVMATLFGLLSMLTYVLGSVHKKPHWLWLSVAFYFLSVFSKEHAIMLPAVLLALTLLLHEDWKQKLRQRWGVFMALAAVAVFVVLAKKGIIGSTYEIEAADMLQKNASEHPYPLSVLTQSWLFFKYAMLWIFPNQAWMSIDMREPFARVLLSPYLLSAACYLAWGAGAFWLLLKRGRSGLVGFALLFPWLMFFTEFSATRIQEEFVLYRSYLWAPGVFCLLPILFSRLPSRKAMMILGIIAIALFALSMERLMSMSRPIFLWDDAEKLVHDHPDLPGTYRIYYNRGTEFIHLGMIDQAIADLKLAIALNKDFPESYGNLGAAYFQKGDWPNAIAAFSRAIDLASNAGKPPSPRYIHGRAQAFENIGQLEKSQVDYRESCRLAKRGCDKLTKN